VEPPDQRPVPSDRVILADGQTEKDITDWLSAMRQGRPDGRAALPIDPPPAGRSPISQPPVSQPPVSPPPAVIPVTFEMNGFGRLEVGYHAVLVEGDALVLVYDHAVGGSPFWTPPAPKPDEVGTAEPLAMMVGPADGADTAVFLAHYTGLRFKDRSREYLVFTIEKAVRPGDQVL